MPSSQKRRWFSAIALDRIVRLRSLLQDRFRSIRTREFERLFGLNPDTTILDVGGTLRNWGYASVSPRLTILNVTHPPADLPQNVRWVVGDAMHLPFKDGAFQIVYSNSTIEHVGGRENQRLVAKEITRAGRSYYVQTPNRYFPIEPHFMTPLVQFMPRRWRHLVLRNLTVWGLLVRPSYELCKQRVDEIRLLDRKDLAEFFPDAELLREPVLGLTKSLIAVRC